MEKHNITMDDVKSAKIDRDEFNFLMCKHFGFYQIADTWIYVRFPPLDDHLSDGWRNEGIQLMSLTYIHNDPISVYRISKLTDENFKEGMSNLIGVVGDNAYVMPKRCDEYLSFLVGSDAWEQKKSELGKRYDFLSNEKYCN